MSKIKSKKLVRLRKEKTICQPSQRIYCSLEDGWYTEFIEEPVREIVKHLRNNGINTIQSCGHNMTIECVSSGDLTKELSVIYFLFEDLKVGKYRVEHKRTVHPEFYPRDYITIYLPKKETGG